MKQNASSQRTCHQIFLLALLMVTMAGTQLLAQQKKTGPAKPAAAATAPPAKKAAAAAPPATVEEARKVLDLTSLPLPEDAEPFSVRELGSATYQVKSDPKQAFMFQQKQLLKLGWTELAGTNVTDAYASGMFSKSGYTLSVTTSPTGQPGKDATAMVSMINLGNVSLKTLPVVKGATSIFASEATAIYTTTTAVPEATEATQKLLAAAGWEPYGFTDVAPEMKQFAFKRNAMKIFVMVSVAPAQNNATSIMYSASLLAADIPAPADAEVLQFNGSQKSLRFFSPQDFAGVAQYYQQTLPARGWKPTTEELITMKDQFGRPIATLVFRNAAEDILLMNLSQSEEKTSAEVTHLTKKEQAEAEKREKQAAMDFLAKQNSKDKGSKKTTADEANEEEMDADALANAAIADALKNLNGKKGGAGKSKKAAKDAVSVQVPKGVKPKQTSENVLQIKVGAGKGLTTAEFILGHLKAAGWKTDEDDDDLDETSGNASLTNENKTITLTFVDTGFADVTMMMIGIGTSLSFAEADAPAAPQE